MSEINVVMTGEEASLFRALQKVLVGQTQVDDKFDDMAKSSKNFGSVGSKSAEDLAEAFKSGDAKLSNFSGAIGKVNRLVSDSRDISQRYKADLVLLNQARAEGTISERDHAAAVKNVTEKYKKAKDSAESFAEKSKKSFGPNSVASLKNYLTGVVSISGALRVAGEAMRFAVDERNKAFEFQKDFQSSVGDFATVSTSGKDLDQLIKASGDIAVKGALDPKVAASLVFAARSANVPTSEVSDIAKFSRITKAESLEGLIGLRQLTDGEYSLSELLNATLSASSNSQSRAGDLIRVAPKLAAGGRLNNTSVAEQLAISSLLADKFSSLDEGANAVKSTETLFATRGKEFGLSGGGLVESIRRFQSLDPEKQKKFIGENQTAIQVINALKDQLERIDQLEQSIVGEIAKTGTENSRANLRLGVVESSLSSTAVFKAEQERIKTELKKSGAFTVNAATVKEIMAREQGQLVDSSAPARLGNQWAINFADFLGIKNETAVTGFGRTGETLARLSTLDPIINSKGFSDRYFGGAAGYLDSTVGYQLNRALGNDVEKRNFDGSRVEDEMLGELKTLNSNLSNEQNRRVGSDPSVGGQRDD